MNPRAAILFAVTPLLCAQGAPSASAGKQLYGALCARCHGVNGEGLSGPDLRTGNYYRAPDDGSLLQIISIGIPDTDMPRQAGLSLNGAVSIAAYLRTFRGLPAPPMSVAASLGEQVYRTKGKCAQCHSMRGLGGTSGPDLTAIGRQRSTEFLRRALLDPSADIAESAVTVHIVSPGGKTIGGVRLSEDTFTIRVRDGEGRLLCFDKAAVKIEYLWDKSPMPGVRETLTAGEIDQLVAYLATRTGER